VKVTFLHEACTSTRQNFLRYRNVEESYMNYVSVLSIEDYKIIKQILLSRSLVWKQGTLRSWYRYGKLSPSMRSIWRFLGTYCTFNSRNEIPEVANNSWPYDKV